MAHERQPQGKGVCWTLRFWAVAVVSILLLSVCFIASSVVTYQLTMDNPNGRLSERHTNHSSISCDSVGTMVSGKAWSCCPKGWRPFGPYCYFISTHPAASWNESEEKCSSMGAHLLVIHSKEEQDFITSILDQNTAYFIGLRDPGHRQWQWIDNTPYIESATFWHTGEPNNEYEQCVVIIRRAGWGWNDIFCSRTQNLVCQMNKIYL